MVNGNGCEGSFDMHLETRHSEGWQAVPVRCLCVAMLAIANMVLPGRKAAAQMHPGPLVSRAELMAIAARADSSARAGNTHTRALNATFAASIRQRLRDGDFQIGDRIVVTMVSDTVHRDTLVVKPGRFLELSDKIVVPLTGVLRSELQERVSSEVLVYVKARQIEVTPLMRLGVLGEVARPGYFGFASDLPLTDLIMGAGGPTAAADLDRSIVRRGNSEYRSADETRKAIGRGLTLDQFGLMAGDELVVGRRRDINPAPIIGFVGAVASVAAVFVALHHR